MIPKNVITESSRIASFYANKNVLVTGSTGFLGRVLVEKLLRSCPQVNNVYLLIRGGSDKCPQTRLKEMIKDPLFQRVKLENGDVLKKLIPILGDLTQASLGMSSKDQKTLASEVNVIFHSGASVSFASKLKQAMDINFHGTSRLLEAAKGMSKLAAFVHVSSCYAHIDRSQVDEVHYKIEHIPDPHKFAQAVNLMEDHLVEQISPKLIGKRPNTYTLSKALTEQMIAMESSRLPICIIRPSIICPTWQEPFPGWVNNFNAMSGMLTTVALGQLKVLHCLSEKNIDLIPADTVSNLMLAAGWSIGANENPSGAIFNSCSVADNPLKYEVWAKSAVDAIRLRPPSNPLSYPSLSLHGNQVTAGVVHLFKHVILSYFMKKKVRAAFWKNLQGLQVYQMFLIQEWLFTTKNTRQLWNKLGSADRQLFDFNPKGWQWSRYLERFAWGIRKYLLKEDDSTLPAARRNLLKLYWMQKITQVTIIVGISAVIGLPFVYM